MIEINLLPLSRPGYVRVRVALDLEAEEFERSQIAALKIALAHFLQLEVAMLRTAAIVRWSPRIDLEIPEAEARQLASFAESDPFAMAFLGPLPIRSIEVASAPDGADDTAMDDADDSPPTSQGDSLFLRILRYTGYLLVGVAALWLVGSVLEGDGGIFIAAVLVLLAGGSLVLMTRRS